MTKLYASAGAIAIAAFFGWSAFHLWSGRLGDAFADCRSGNVAGAAIGGPFELLDQNGATVTDTQIFAKPTLVYFGFASCPDVCPLDNARNVEAVQMLANEGIDAAAVFISVDPARDTPAVLKDYVANFGDTLIGLTGTPEQIKAAAAAFKVYYQVPAAATGDYEVDHTTLTYLMMPKTGFVDFFQRQTTSADMAGKVSCFVKAS
ncbi:MAG: SCO family protein [Candidatus Saccharibacteria bacterium]|nr:SCO family protein [Pseudorhodobacter sp.]